MIDDKAKMAKIQKYGYLLFINVYLGIKAM